MRSGVALVVFLVVRAAGAQELVPPAAMEARIAPGSFEEMCFQLGAGEAVRYAFDADAALDFNVHWHRGNQLLFPVRSRAVARRGGIFASAMPQAYCLMW